jgi:hypothetical protein
MRRTRNFLFGLLVVSPRRLLDELRQRRQSEGSEVFLLGLRLRGLASGQLITNIDPGQPDTGLRFIEPTRDDGPFLCPACGAEAGAQEA